jgi:ABC-type nitrate/sulfonate/bicarbonate transport system substrate-binding protein
MTPEEIAREFSLPVDAIREAIAYCESNPPELAEDYAREEALSNAAGMNEPEYKRHPTPKLLSPQEIARINHEDLPR